MSFGYKHSIMYPKIILSFLLLITLVNVNRAQQLTQNIKGVVVDNVTQSPLPGVTIIVMNTDPVKGAVSDMDGNFKINQVPVGTVNLVANFTGYKPAVLSNLSLISGKEMSLTIQMEEDINSIQAVEVVAETDKRETMNTMAGVSSRTFSVEETQKFAAAVNDPGRMATSFAGVIAANDGNNNISIRGNSPYGLLWRMEGVDIPNPNHFSAPATSGGGISILSAQLLSNSDFMTGAFSAEYGNALSGVFDLRLRKGNNEKREYTFQAGFLGLDAAVEGPFKKGYDGSYLMNYRYSTLSVISNLGINVGDAVTNFQDFSFNVSLPTKNAGTFGVFGFGGLSNQAFKAESDSTKWERESDRERGNYFSNTGAVGLKHQYIFNEKHSLQSVILGSGTSLGYIEDRYDDNMRFEEIYREKYANTKVTVSTVWNWKLNARNSMRSGVYVNRLGFDLYKEYKEESTQLFVRPLDEGNGLTTTQAFSQWKHRLSDHVQLLAGVHYLGIPSTGRHSVEPRASVRYTTTAQHVWSLGYGLHSQVQPLGVYYGKITDASGVVRQPNRNLDFNKAHHIVASYDHKITNKLHAKLEGYYQHLYNIAIEDVPGSSNSSLNIEFDYVLEPMVNQGFGRNYGIEFTLEQFTHNGMYFLLSGALFDSEYKAKDGVWRDTRYNAGRSLTFTGGKDWKIGAPEKNRTFSFNMRAIYSGGMRRTPIDLQASIESGEAQLIENRAFTIQNADYFRTDVRFSVKRNRAKSTSTLSLDIQNVSNRANIGGTYFDLDEAAVKTWTMTPLIPVLSYKIEF